MYNTGASCLCTMSIDITQNICYNIITEREIKIERLVHNMKTCKQKELRRLAQIGAARDVTNADPELFKGHEFEKIAVSRGIYGINGGLVKDYTLNELLVTIGRSSMTFFLF